MVALPARLLAAPSSAHLSRRPARLAPSNTPATLRAPTPVTAPVPLRCTPAIASCPRPLRRIGHRGSAAAAAAAAAAAPFPADDGPSLDPVGNGFLASLRAVLFYGWTFLLAIPLFACMMAIFPLVWVFDKFKRTSEHMMNNVWAKLSTFPFYKVEIIGKENLPSNDVPAVYVANHASYLDIYTLFHLDRNFKFISKLSNFLIPLIGWSMFLTGHVPLVRNERRSQMEALKTCRGLLEKGCSLLFFPEGTRTADGKMHDFKKGAFSVAAKMKAPVVPITMVGAYQLMKNGDEGRLFPGTIRVVIHPMIDGKVDADTMMKQSYKAIAGAMPPGAVA